MRDKFLIILMLLSHCNGYAITNLNKSLGTAIVSFKNNILVVSTGQVKRQWNWTGAGFQTVSYVNLHSGKEWCTHNLSYKADWNLPERIDDKSEAKLVGVDCIESNDEKFTENHLLVSISIEYSCGIDLKYLIRVYPNALGIWTALEVKRSPSFSPEGIPEDLETTKYYGSTQPVKIARNEFIPFDFSQPNQRRYWGLYNDPGNRHNTRNMVKEEVIDGFPLFQDEYNSWASGLSIESEGEGLILLKESNKTVNNYGHQTGCFNCTPNGVELTGWGLKPSEITNTFKRTWATWSVLFSGSEDEMQLALKEFDRLRYPINLDRDMHILVDTWGSDWQNGEYDKIYGRDNSEFSVVEKEIKSASDLGIDVVRIDDGWQEGPTLSYNTWHPNPNVGYEPHWENVNKLSEDYNVRIGLWAAVRFISPEELVTNQKELNVATWKFDFDKLEDHDDYFNRMKEIREFIKKTSYSTQISWCPEYDDQRYGWYSPNREYGLMYFQNIKNNMPHHLVYVPYITLRHHWMISKFYNLQELQLNWQNPSRTNPEFSDANRHSQSYCAMTALMGAPSAFFLTQLLKPNERDELRKMISIYKENREKIFESFVFPIGHEPNNASWTGFQIYHPEKDIGYLMIFRELHNKDNKANIKLKFLQDKTIRLTNLETKEVKTVVLKDNFLEFEIDHPAGYQFLKYEIIELKQNIKKIKDKERPFLFAF